MADSAAEQFAEGPLDYKLTSDMDLLEAVRELRLTLPGQTAEETAFQIWRRMDDLSS